MPTTGILITCPRCRIQRVLRDESKLGKVAQCPRCKHLFKLQATPPPTQTATAAEQKTETPQKRASPAMVVLVGTLLTVVTGGMYAFFNSTAGEDKQEVTSVTNRQHTAAMQPSSEPQLLPSIGYNGASTPVKEQPGSRTSDDKESKRGTAIFGGYKIRLSEEQTEIFNRHEETRRNFLSAIGAKDDLGRRSSSQTEKNDSPKTQPSVNFHLDPQNFEATQASALQLNEACRDMDGVALDEFIAQKNANLTSLAGTQVTWRLELQEVAGKTVKRGNPRIPTNRQDKNGVFTPIAVKFKIQDEMQLRFSADIYSPLFKEVYFKGNDPGFEPSFESKNSVSNLLEVGKHVEADKALILDEYSLRSEPASFTLHGTIDKVDIKHVVGGGHWSLVRVYFRDDARAEVDIQPYVPTWPRPGSPLAEHLPLPLFEFDLQDFSKTRQQYAAFMERHKHAVRTVREKTGSLDPRGEKKLVEYVQHLLDQYKDKEIAWEMEVCGVETRPEGILVQLLHGEQPINFVFLTAYQRQAGAILTQSQDITTRNALMVGTHIAVSAAKGIKQDDVALVKATIADIRVVPYSLTVEMVLNQTTSSQVEN